MDLTYVDEFINCIKFDENSNKSALDLLIDLQSNFKKLKVEILTNKIRLQSHDVKDYYELLIMLLKDAKPDLERHHLLVVQYWLEYYEINFTKVLDRSTPQDFTIYFAEDNINNFNDNPSSKDFQIAFSNCLCYKFYEKAQHYILESRYEFLSPNLLQVNSGNSISKHYYDLFFSDYELFNVSNELGLGVVFYNEIVLYSIYVLLKNEIEENLIVLPESKIEFYLDNLESNITNSDLLVYPYGINSMLEKYNESSQNIEKLENKNLFYPLSYPKYLSEVDIGEKDFNYIQYSLSKYAKYQLGLKLHEFVKKMKKKFSLGNVEEIITLEVSPIEMVAENVVENQYANVNQNSNHTIFNGDEGVSLFNRIYDELSIVPGRWGSQTRFMAIWKDYKVRDFIFKKATILTNYVDFLNNEYGTNYNSKSKSKSGRYTSIVKDVYNLHIKEIKEKDSNPL